jgi:diguanylate cyclase (GGDEF)-like protein
LPVSAGCQHSPWLSASILAAFLGLTFARLVVRQRYLAQPDRAAASLQWQWAVLTITALLWGATSTWALLDPAFAAARTVTLIATVALAMAFSQVFAVDPRRSLFCTLVVYLPAFAIALLVEHDYGLALVMGLNSVYLVVVIGRSHREYQSKLDAEQELREQRDRFAQQSRIDALTGVANRRHFAQVLQQWVEEAQAAPLPFVLMIFDLDWFKTINDRHGHAVGDATLRTFAHLLQSHFRGPQELVARLGGEEFAVLIRDCAVAAAEPRADAFRAELAGRPLPIAGLALGLTVSVGVGGFEPTRHADGDALYHVVDEALYRAKASGRNVVCRADVTS